MSEFNHSKIKENLSDMIIWFWLLAGILLMILSLWSMYIKMKPFYIPYLLLFIAGGLYVYLFIRALLNDDGSD